MTAYIISPNLLTMLTTQYNMIEVCNVCSLKYIRIVIIQEETQLPFQLTAFGLGWNLAWARQTWAPCTSLSMSLRSSSELEAVTLSPARCSSGPCLYCLIPVAVVDAWPYDLHRSRGCMRKGYISHLVPTTFAVQQHAKAWQKSTLASRRSSPKSW